MPTPVLVEPGPGAVTGGYEQYGMEGTGSCRAQQIIGSTLAPGQVVYKGTLKKGTVKYGKGNSFNGYYGEKKENGLTTKYLCYSDVKWKKKPPNDRNSGGKGKGKFEGMAQ